MKLFENKIGRPSNDILEKRKSFVYMTAFVVASIITATSIILTSSYSISELNKLDMSSNSNSSSNLSKLKGAAGITTTTNTNSLNNNILIKYDMPVTIVNKVGKQKVEVTIINKTNSKKYYRMFSYTNSLNKKTGQTACLTINPNSTTKINKTINIKNLNSTYFVKSKVYANISDCKKDSSGMSKALANDTKRFVGLKVTTKIKIETTEDKPVYNKEKNVYEVKNVGNYQVKFERSSNTSGEFYYRIFTYQELDAKSNPSSNSGCKKGKVTMKNINMNISLTKLSNKRSIAYKEYSDQKSCISDVKGKNTNNVINSSIVNYQLIN